MGIDRLTAMIIVSRRDVCVYSAGPNEEGKWAGLITLSESDRFQLLVDSKYVFNSSAEAIQDMNRVIKELREGMVAETKAFDEKSKLVGLPLRDVLEHLKIRGFVTRLAWSGTVYLVFGIDNLAWLVSKEQTKRVWDPCLADFCYDDWVIVDRFWTGSFDDYLPFEE